MRYRPPIEAWLIDLAGSAYPGPNIARRLVRMLIGVGMRTGHSLDLDDSALRNQICVSARRGLVPDATIRCVRCGVDAKFIDWDTLGSMGIDMHRNSIVQAAREQSLPLFGYLLQCNPAVSARQAAPPGGTHG